MERVVATINAENKYEAIAALEILLEKVKKYGPSEKIEHKVMIDSKGENYDDLCSRKTVG